MTKDEAIARSILYSVFFRKSMVMDSWLVVAESVCLSALQELCSVNTTVTTKVAQICLL